MQDYLNYIFDENDPGFISVQDELPFWSAPFGLRLLDTIKIRKGINILDIGSGFGFPLMEIAQRMGNTCKVFGIDPWKPAIERTKLKIKKLDILNVSIIEGSAEELPFEDNYFNLIISNNGVNNVPDMGKVFKECYRVCGKGGQFVFTLNLDGTMSEFYNILEKALKEENLTDEIKGVKTHIHKKRKPVMEIEALLQSAGFETNVIIRDKFIYRFADAGAMFNYSMIKCWFLPSWKELVPENKRKKVFQRIEDEFNRISEERGEIILSVPFAVFNSEKG